MKALKEVKRRSGKTPGPLLNKPNLSEMNNFYWIAFCDLSKFNPISYQEILAYADLSRLDRTELFVKVSAIEEVLKKS